MGKMWATAVASAATIALMATLVSGAIVHFNDTHMDCNDPENVTLVTECMYLHWVAMDNDYWNFSLSFEEYVKRDCIMRLETIACVETAQCHCDWGKDHDNQLAAYDMNAYYTFVHNNISNCANATYGETIGSDVFGPLDAEAGVNCSKFNIAIGDMALELATVNSPAVIAIAETCDEMLACYRQFDAEAALALYHKDLHTFCISNNKLIECVVNASCDCDQYSNETMIKLVRDERDFFRYNCDMVLDLPAVDMQVIDCPGVSKCNSSDPMYQCRLDFFEVGDAVGYNPTLTCQAELDWAYCVENLSCECGFYQDPFFYKTLAVSKQLYGLLDYYYNCLELTGPFPNHTGLDCPDDDRFTEAEKFLTISLALAGFVSTEEARCSGILSCFNDSLDEVSEAYRDKNLTAMCLLDAKVVGCLEATYCDCDVHADPEVQAKLKAEEDEFYYYCTYNNVDAEIPNVFCPDCSSADAMNTCEDEQDEVDWATEYLDVYCPALFNLANCTERVACECGFYNQSDYYHALAIAKYDYEDNYCFSYAGEFPSHDGLICAVGPDGLPAKLVSVALANTDFVKGEEAACPGIKQCYEEYDSAAIDAYHQKELTQVCQVEQDRILCVEEKYCQCGKAADEETLNKIIDIRLAHNEVCYDVIGEMSVPEKCRHESLCSTEDPLLMCHTEYAWDDYATKSFYDVCESIKNYYVCMEDMACLCGLVSNGSSEVSLYVYNYTTLILLVYDQIGCNSWNEIIEPGRNGTECADHPDDDTLRRLVLSSADSSEVAAMTSKCYRVHKCFSDDDRHKAHAYYTRDYLQLCKISTDLIACLDEAYCRCGMNGTTETEDYISLQINVHNEYCSPLSPVTREECVSLSAELESQCDELKECTEDVDQTLADLLSTKKYTQFCQKKWKFVGCVDEALCKCELNGTDNAKDYRDAQLSYHQEYCGSCSPILQQPKKCDLLDYDKECKDIKKCHQKHDATLDGAVCNQTEFCKEKKKLIVDCLDTAICDCKKNGTAKAIRYRDRQVAEFDAFCSETIDDPKSCKKVTGAAVYLRSSALLLTLILLAGVAIL